LEMKATLQVGLVVVGESCKSTIPNWILRGVVKFGGEARGKLMVKEGKPKTSTEARIERTENGLRRRGKRRAFNQLQYKKNHERARGMPDLSDKRTFGGGGGLRTSKGKRGKPRRVG